MLGWCTVSQYLGTGHGFMGSGRSSDSNPRYWQEYSNLQYTKHQLIQEYLKGWFPKLGTWQGRIVYLDTHAGRGRHATGALGSPLIALRTFLDHSHRDRILENCEVVFFFIELDPDNVQELEQEIEQLKPLPRGVRVEILPGSCFEVLREGIEQIRETHRGLAPAFIFVDPYGFKVPGSILHELMGFPRVELFVNIIWRELDMAMRQPDNAGISQVVNSVFDGPSWRERITSCDYDRRGEQASIFYKEMTGAKWATYIRMLGDNQVTRYLLLHLTNHDAGRDLMKECMWKVCPEGGFYARKSDNPAQQFLITPEPDLAPLADWVRSCLSGGPRRWEELGVQLRHEVWLDKHLSKVIRGMRTNKVIEADGYQGRFSRKANPRLRLLLEESSGAGDEDTD